MVRAVWRDGTGQGTCRSHGWGAPPRLPLRGAQLTLGRAALHRTGFLGERVVWFEESKGG